MLLDILVGHQEKQIAKKVNGRLQSNSGAGLFKKRGYRNKKLAIGSKNLYERTTTIYN